MVIKRLLLYDSICLIFCNRQYVKERKGIIDFQGLVVVGGTDGLQNDTGAFQSDGHAHILIEWWLYDRVHVSKLTELYAKLYCM